MKNFLRFKRFFNRCCKLRWMTSSQCNVVLFWRSGTTHGAMSSDDIYCGEWVEQEVPSIRRASEVAV